MTRTKRIHVGARVGTIDGPPGTVRYMGRNNDSNNVVDVELDGHTYGPGKPYHRYPVGMVWALDESPAPVEPTRRRVRPPSTAPAAPSWHPTATDDGEARS